MKKIFLLTAFTCLFTVFCHAQKKYEMVVEKTDGSNIVVNTEDIIRTYFRERTGGGNNEGGIGDTSQAYLACPDDNHPHMIDLGLPSGTRWACCNVGAPLPETIGGYYAWGETEEKNIYDWYTYIHCDGSAKTCHDLGENIAGTKYDVACVKWGGPWRMPSLDQIKELLRWCNIKWTSRNGIKGCLFTSYKSGGTIFLPAAGHRDETYLYGAGSFGYFWSSTPDPLDVYGAYDLRYESGTVYNSEDIGGRSDGQSVRPVVSGILLSLSALELTKGNKGTVNILSGNGNYTVQTSDPAVATATIDNNTVVISGVGDGTATITVTETQNKWLATISVMVKYNSCPDDHHPHMIDLGLPSGTKWACCNVDTDHPENQSPTNYGGYYAWGETETKIWSMYSEEKYKYYQNGNYVNIGSDIAGTEYDVAHVKWGGAWQMPSEDQIKELIDKCKYKWTEVNGVSGGWFISKINGVSIFMPAAGYASSLHGGGSDGCYWSSTQHPSYSRYAYDLLIDSDRADLYYLNLYDGYSVRPVVRK